MIGGGIDRILKAADVISEVRRAFEKISLIEQNQRNLAGALDAIDRRVRELEASLREARSEIQLSAVQAAQGTVNGAQSQIFERILDIELRIQRIGEDVSGLGNFQTRKLPVK